MRLRKGYIMIKEIRGGVWYTHDNRQVCQNTAAGRREYALRRFKAWEAQGGICALCGKYVSVLDAEADHIAPRGMGGARRDDSQSNLQAVHHLCNSAKGSRRMPYVITQNS